MVESERVNIVRNSKQMKRRIFVIVAAVPLGCFAAAASGDNSTKHRTEWSVYGGDTDNTHDSTLKQNLTTVLCPYADNSPSTPLSPNQTVRWRRYVTLTSSGHVTLTTKEGFAPSPVSPLEGHWPSLQLVVNPSIPPDRVITTQQHGNQIIISAPQEARGQLLYLSAFECISSVSGSYSRLRSSGGPSDWHPLRGLQFQLLPIRDCSGPTELLTDWTYVVGAPGYAMVSGSYLGR